MNIGETIFSAFLQALFQQLMSPGVISGFLKLFGGENLPKTIKKCKDQLTVMETLLRSAEQKQIDDEVVRPLKEDLQDIALDLEDILDELATQAHLYELEKMDQEDDNNDHQLNPTNHVSEFLGSSANHMVKNIIGRAAESVSTLFNPIASISSRLDRITERLHDLQLLLQFSGLSAIHAMPQQTHQAESSHRSRETSSLLDHDPDLVEMQDDIIEKCKGLPLTVKTLAGLLKSTVDKRQRQEILDSSLWSQKNDLLPALMLSYRHLPPHLKHIFAYMSITPKNVRFSEEFSVLQWMAQGFLAENKTSRMEDIGHNYFLDLVSRSLIEKYRGNMFIMHDLIHDLAQWAAGDLSCIIGPGNKPRDLKRTRHLCITKHSSDGTLGNQLSGSQLRTFRMFDDNPNIEILDFLQKFQYVRFLHLNSELIEELPECIGGLKQLRFLSITSEKIQVLPKSISRLFNLQTLKLGGCYNLKEVPHVGFLVKLRRLYIRMTSLKEMPLGFGNGETDKPADFR
ncbi:hypothetical protein BVRB_2g042260 [Beta vulgaris subsp. vulgaris]|nr:hypothetical protein BVRB_2g042260 [Beta vulgaris subsp. vulgaris]